MVEEHAMNVLLVNPNQMQPPVAPLALDYLGQALQQNHIGVDVLDLCLDSMGPRLSQEVLAKVTASCPSAFLVTIRNIDDAYCASQHSFIDNYRNLIAQLHQLSNAPVIVGGCGFSIAPDKMLTFLEANYGIQGTCEHDIVTFLAGLEDPDRFPFMPGLVWRERGEIRCNQPSQPEMSVDVFSKRTIVRNRDYYRLGGMVGIETKRGCTGSCTYCVDPVAKGSKVFTKPLAYLIEEIISLLDQGICVFHLCDSEFNVPPHHAFEVCRAIIDEGLSQRIRWYTYASPVGFGDSLAFAMAEAGCVGINFGVDHCCPEVLSALGRQHSCEDLERVALSCHRAGIVTLFDLLLGGIGETRTTLKKVIAFCKHLTVERVGVPVGIRIYPNTPLAQAVCWQKPFSAYPHFQGVTHNNDDLLYPLFYVSASLGSGWMAFLDDLVADDPRFLFPLREKVSSNYNYNDNEVLKAAIAKGHKGAFWDILRRIHDNLPPLGVGIHC